MAMTLRLTDEQDRIVEALAARDGVSKAEAVTRAVMEKAQRIGHESLVRKYAHEEIEHYRELLDLLAQ